MQVRDSSNTDDRNMGHSALGDPRENEGAVLKTHL